MTRGAHRANDSPEFIVNMDHRIQETTTGWAHFELA